MLLVIWFSFLNVTFLYSFSPGICNLSFLILLLGSLAKNLKSYSFTINLNLISRVCEFMAVGLL